MDMGRSNADPTDTANENVQIHRL